jgi:hypothetical protein
MGHYPTMRLYTWAGWLARHLSWGLAHLMAWHNPRAFRLAPEPEGIHAPLTFWPERAEARAKARDLRPEPPDDDWCPAHDTWFAAETECPGCRDEWESTWALGEEPGELHRRDDWSDQEEERSQTDAWYQDMIARASYPKGGSDV